MKRIETDLPGVYVLEPVVHGDERGFFMESYNERVARELGFYRSFVQDNHSSSRGGVLRGLHYQLHKPQAKLVRVMRGTVFDVAVDVRRDSPTFGKAAWATLSAENKRMFFVPEGYAHGFYVISDEAEFLYKCSDFYAPEDERGLAWDEPSFEIPWPIPEGTTPVLSSRDSGLPRLADCPREDLPEYAGEAIS